MTNAEAIELLDSFRICVAPTLSDAMSVAISALKAQEEKTQLSREDTTSGVQKTCITCKHYPPESKWPCIDCDMRNPADRWEPQELSKNSTELDKGNGELHPTCTGSCTGSCTGNEELKQEVKNSIESSSTHKALDTISRQAAIDAFMTATSDGDKAEWCRWVLKQLPSAQPETNCSEIPNTSDFVSRKAVREMVATWSYDMAEWEDVELALHDVDELPSAQPEVIHCKDCKHYRTTGAFGVPLHKEEYFCDADNYPKNDPGEEQRKLPEWWFCAGAERRTDG